MSSCEGRVAKKVRHGRFAMRLYALVLVCSAFPFNGSAQLIAGNGKAIELTESDFFGLPDWQHKSVAISGFVLGMTRAQVLALANGNHFALRSNMPVRTVGEINGPCRQASCSLSEVNGNWIGVDLFFDADRLAKITVSVPVDADSEVKKVNIARKFKGLTY